MIYLPLIAGTLASMLHVISGPDHLAAVTPLAIQSQRKAWKVGLSWGFGHLIGMLLIGVLHVLFQDFIPISIISDYSEQLVAFILIGVGFWALYRIFNEHKLDNLPHIHVTDKPIIHIHKHQHNNTEKEHQHKKTDKQNVFTSFGIGFIHGLAGIAHFILLLPVLSFDNKIEGIQYVVGFGIGTIIAMTVYAIIFGKIADISKQQNSKSFFIGIRLTGGVFAIIIGFYWLYLTMYLG